jgi:hypothetical protein
MGPASWANVASRLEIEGLVMFNREIQFDADNYTIMVATLSANSADSVVICL